MKKVESKILSLIEELGDYYEAEVVTTNRKPLTSTPIALKSDYYYITAEGKFDIEIICTQTSEDNTVIYLGMMEP